MISLVLIILAGFFKSVMDTLQFHFTVSIFPQTSKFWNPEISWMNKWKEGTTTVEAYPGSSTVFVAFTDAWHAAQFGFLACVFLAIILYKPLTKNKLLDFVILRVSFGVVFELLFKYALVN